MKKPKRKLTKAQRIKLHRAQLRQEKLDHNADQAAMLMQRLVALGDFDANAPHIRLLAILVDYLFQRELGNE